MKDITTPRIVGIGWNVCELQNIGGCCDRGKCPSWCAAAAAAHQYIYMIVEEGAFLLHFYTLESFTKQVLFYSLPCQQNFVMYISAHPVGTVVIGTSFK